MLETATRENRKEDDQEKFININININRQYSLSLPILIDLQSRVLPLQPQVGSNGNLTALHLDLQDGAAGNVEGSLAGERERGVSNQERSSWSLAASSVSFSLS